jgi:CBS domain-containing protein
MGSLIGQLLPVSPAERKIVLAAGAAAGMAATFGTPIAAVVLAIELLLFEFSTRAFIPLVVASAIAAGMHALLFGAGPLFAVPAHDYAGLAKLPFFIIMGPLCGLLAVVITKGLFVAETGYRKLPVSEFWHPIIGALGFAIVGFFVPRVLFVGYDVIGDVLATKLAVGTVAVILVAKLLAWWVALGSGTSGGTLAPVMLVGAAFGSLFGSVVGRIDPGLHLAAGAFAVVAMAAVFGAASRATFASIVFVFEVTQDFHIVLPLMLASVLADLVASALLRDSLMTEKLSRRGLQVRNEYEVDVLRAIPVSEVMSRVVRTVPADMPVARLRRMFAGGGHGGYPVVDGDGRVVGMVARTDLLEERAPDGATALDVGSEDVVSIGPDDPLLEALQRILSEKVEHLPVMDDGRLVGSAHERTSCEPGSGSWSTEQAQPGWRPTSVPWRRWRRSA